MYESTPAAVRLNVENVSPFGITEKLRKVLVELVVTSNVALVPSA
jgi:hypothetical protein